MNIGLFFGSFNPIHIGHMMIAHYMAHFTELDEVWLVVSPLNPFKRKNDLIEVYDRLEMVKLATEDDDKIRVSDIELSLPQPSYTIDTLVCLSERYPQHHFGLIMGEDNLQTLYRWKNYDIILRDYRIWVYPRHGQFSPHELLNHSSVILTETPKIELSATFIRHALAEGKDMRYFVPDKVLDFIERKGLFR